MVRSPSATVCGSTGFGVEYNPEIVLVLREELIPGVPVERLEDDVPVFLVDVPVDLEGVDVPYP